MESCKDTLTAENFKTIIPLRFQEKFLQSELLETKFNSDIQTIEILKYEFYDHLKKCNEN